MNPTDAEREWVTDAKLGEKELAARLARFPSSRRSAVAKGRVEFWNSADIVLDRETVLTCVEEGIMLSRMP